MVKLQIPKVFLPGFDALSELDNEKVSKIVAFIGSVPVGTGPKTFEGLFNKSFPDLENTNIAPALFSLGSFKNWEITEITSDEISNKLVEAYKENVNQDISDESFERLKNNLLIFLKDTGFLGPTYKAFSLLAENSRVLRKSHIVSDIRLVFGESLENAALGGLILHSLKLETEENDETKDFYFSLSSTDLVKLKEQIERAEQKEAAIRKQYHEILPIINITE